MALLLSLSVVMAPFGFDAYTGCRMQSGFSRSDLHCESTDRQRHLPPVQQCTPRTALEEMPVDLVEPWLNPCKNTCSLSLAPARRNSGPAHTVLGPDPTVTQL